MDLCLFVDFLFVFVVYSFEYEHVSAITTIMWTVERTDEPPFLWLHECVAIAISVRKTFIERNPELSSHVNLCVQGQSRRVQVEVRSVPDSGTMPLITASILSVTIGDVKIRQMRPSKGSESQWVRRESYQLLILVTKLLEECFLIEQPWSLPFMPALCVWWICVPATFPQTPSLLLK